MAEQEQAEFRPGYRSPMRVLVKGPSTVLWTSWMSGPRTDFGFPRVIESELIARGRPVEVRNTGILGQPMGEWFDDFEFEVARWSPDVVVMDAGHYETVHLILPHWYERYSNRPNSRPGPIRDRFRKWVVRPVWKVAAKVQSKLDTWLPPWVTHRRMVRAAAAFEAYVKLVQQVGSPLMLLVEMLTPPPRQLRWFPGMGDRVAELNQLHQEVIDRLGLPHVRMVRISELVDRRYDGDLSAATPDGFHFTPELHGDIGAELAGIIDEWAAGQSHLSQD